MNPENIRITTSTEIKLLEEVSELRFHVVELDALLSRSHDESLALCERVAELEALHRTYYNQPYAEACIRAASEDRERILAALIAFLDNGGGTFRKWLGFLGMDYHPAYLEGWMGFTNALCDHESRILGKEPEPLI